MKYVVSAGIGGLFGISVPMMMDAQQIKNEEVPRIEDSQPVENRLPAPINGVQIPDDICGYINYKSDEPKEQAKECLSVPILAVPAI
jgi:hypothetical protein